MADRIEKIKDSFYSDPRVMVYDHLVEAIEHAEENNYNRNINLETFEETVEEFGYNPKTVNYPVLPLCVHEHAQGKKVDPHVRVKVVGPLCPNDTLVVEAILDCSFEIFKKLPIFDVENKKILWAN